MNQNLDCQVFFNSTEQAPPVLSCGEPVDVAADPAAAHQLIKLGISPRHDLPAVLLREPGGKIRVVGLRLSPEEASRLAGGEGFPTSRRLVYSSAWCPDCRRAKRVLEEVAARYDEVDIDRDPQAEATVLERSGGRRVVPTLLFDDRLWAFNPDPPLLRRLLDGQTGRA
ncbi:MAG TPA: glutaredoxin family protein [Thermoanaerobaculia bacterium]|nr:glutaredoxin family protein [Thermoanaerobaculia bacterium]